MDVRELMKGMHGQWAGRSELHMAPGTPMHESDSRLRVGPVALGQFVALDYSWDYEGRQEGWLLLAKGASAEAVNAVWVDSFHTMEGIMSFEGSVDAAGLAKVTGSYSFGDAPPWGWRIELGGQPDGGLNITMYNIDPEGTEYLAVKADYRRVVQADCL